MADSSNSTNNPTRANFAEYFAVVGLGPVELQQQVKDTKIVRSGSSSSLDGLTSSTDNNSNKNDNNSELPSTRNRRNSKGALSPSSKVENIFKKVFKAHIIDRYPYESANQESNDTKQTTPFPSGLPLFCFPDGYKFSKDNGVPTFFTFVSTGAGGEHVYGHCLTIYDLISPAAYAVLHSAGNIPGVPEPEIMSGSNSRGGDVDENNNNNEDNDDNNMPRNRRRSRSSSNILRRQSIVVKMYAPKCLCLITKYPFISQCRDILTSLYRLVLSPLDVPIERYICNLMNEVPMPPSGMAKILYTIADKELIFTRPPVNKPIENVDLPFDKTFQCLGIQTTLSIFKCLLLEQKVLFHSSQLSLLTAVPECILAFLYPFSWEHVYIPVLPRPLLGVLQAPMPFICGMQTGLFDEIQDEIPENIVVVNIDNDKIFIPDMDRASEIPPLPEKEEQKLVKALQEIAEPVRLNRPGGGDDDIWRETCLNMMDSAFSFALRADQFDDEDGIMTRDWYKVRLAFLRFFVSMFREYKKYVVTKNSKANTSSNNSSTSSTNIKYFDTKAFVNAQRSSSKTFLKIFTETQTFSKFMDECVHEDQEEANYDVKFFNESIAQKRNRSLLTFRKYSTPFLESEKHEIQKTVVCFAPDKANLPQPPPLTEKTFDGHGSGDLCGKYTYSYDSFPPLQKSLYIDPRPLPEMPIDPKEASARNRRKNAGFWVTHPGTKKDYNSDSTIYCVWFLTLAAISSNDIHEEENSALNNNIASDKQRMKSSVKKRRQQLRRLGSAFAILNRMKQQEIGRDELIYKSLIDASGRCGSTHHALLVLKHMKEDGLKPDSLFFSCLASAFSMDTTIPMVGSLPLGLLDAWEDNMKDDDEKMSFSNTPSPMRVLSKSSTGSVTRRASSITSSAVKKPPTAQRASLTPFSSYFGYGKKPSLVTKEISKPDATSTTTVLTPTTELKDDTNSNTHVNEASKKEVDLGNNLKKTANLKRDETESKGNNNGNDVVKTPERIGKKNLHLKLTEDCTKALHLTPTLSSLVSPRGTGFRILESVFPTLSIDTDRETCPKCNRKVNQMDVWNGFVENDPNDYTTVCPDENCGRRFVARFTVFSTAEDWVGTLGPKKPLFFEALSPWGLKKEVRTILINSGGFALSSAESFRSSSPTIFWNLVLYFRQFSLPLDFLVLQTERETIKLKLIGGTVGRNNTSNDDSNTEEQLDLEESDKLDGILSTMLNHSNDGAINPRSMLDTLEKADQRLHTIMAKIGPNWRHQMKGSPEIAAVEAASKARLELDSVLGRIDSSSAEDISEDVDRAVAHVDVAAAVTLQCLELNILDLNGEIDEEEK